MAATDPQRGVTLDELAADPALASALPVEAVSALLVRHAVVGQLLLGRLLAAPPPAPPSPTPAPQSPDLLTIKEAAARIGVPASRVKTAIRDGTLRSQKIGHYRRVRPEWLDAFVRAEEQLTP